jgi:hypothetical protein
LEVIISGPAVVVLLGLIGSVVDVERLISSQWLSSVARRATRVHVTLFHYFLDRPLGWAPYVNRQMFDRRYRLFPPRYSYSHRLRTIYHFRTLTIRRMS